MENACNYNQKKSKRFKKLKQKVLKARQIKIRRLKRRKLIKRRLRQLVSLSILFGTLFLLFSFIKLIYLTKGCKDLDYASNYYFTNGDNNESLLRIQNSTLIFSDSDSAVIKATGLSSSSPHKKTILEGHFKKGFFNSWKLENVYVLENN